MPTKQELITTILNELRKAQTEEWKPPKSGRIGLLDLPPRLALGNGKHLKATRELLSATEAYASLSWANDIAARSRFKYDEFATLVQEAFAKTLAKADLDRANEDLVAEVIVSVHESLDEETDRQSRLIEVTAGCHLFEGDDAYPLRIGPVLFETREQFRRRLIANGKLSSITARRLAVIWSGKRQRKRKPSADFQTEEVILKAIGDCPVVCTIETYGLSSKNVQEKGLLAARLAMAAISLMWEHPSQGLEWMRLLYDRKLPLRYTMWFGEGRYPGSSSSISEFPHGRSTDDKLLLSLTDNQWLFDQIGEALLSFVQPERPVARPETTNAIFLSLLWFHEALLDPLDQVAVTKYAASMDALVGGKGAPAIVRLLGAQLGYKPNDPLFKDGPTTNKAIEAIYKAGRSQLIHGVTKEFGHDWKLYRLRAEVASRLCLTSACDWLFRNKDCDSLEALRMPQTKRPQSSETSSSPRA